MGRSLGFVTDVFYFLLRAMEHIIVSSIAPLELYFAIGDLYFSLLFEFQVIRKGCIF